MVLPLMVPVGEQGASAAGRIMGERLRRLTVVCRSLGRREDVVAELRWLAGFSAEHGRWASYQRAIYYEHHARDLTQARGGRRHAGAPASRG